MALINSSMTPALKALTEHLEGAQRLQVLAYGNPNLASELRELHKTPSRISRFSAEAATEVIELIDDVLVLEKIATVDTRVTVRDCAQYRAKELGASINTKIMKPDFEKQTKNALKHDVTTAVEKLKKLESVNYPLIIEWIDSLNDEECMLAVSGLVASRHPSRSDDLLLAFGRALERIDVASYYALQKICVRYEYVARNIVMNWPSEFSLRIAELASEIHFRDRYGIFSPEDDDFARRYYMPSSRWSSSDEDEDIEETPPASPALDKTLRKASPEAVAYWCEVGDWDLLLWCNALTPEDLDRAVDAVSGMHEPSLMASFLLAAPTSESLSYLLEKALERSWFSQSSPDRSDDLLGLTNLLKDPTGLSDRALIALCELSSDHETANYLIGSYGVVPEAVLMAATSHIDVKGMIWHLRYSDDELSSGDTSGLQSYAEVFFSHSESLREYFAQARHYQRSGPLDRIITEKLVGILGSNADAWPVFFSLLNVAQSGTLEEISNAALACA